MFINNYINFVNFLLLRQNYERYFYNSIFNNASGENNLSIYSSYPYHIKFLDTFVTSSAAKSCFITSIKSIDENNNICNIEAQCRTCDGRYLCVNISIKENTIPYLINCNGNLSITHCHTEPLSQSYNVFLEPKDIKNCYTNNDCNINSIIENRCDRHSFYQCQKSMPSGTWIVYKHMCPNKNNNERLIFDTKLKICNY